MSRITQIYVALLGEGVDVWRPVQAEHLYGKIYRILDQARDPSIESWQFEPGDEVICEETAGDDGHFLAAVSKLAKSSDS